MSSHPLPQILALLGCLCGVGWLFWWWQRDEDEEARLNIAPADWKAKRKRVAARMDGRPEWLRVLHRHWRGHRKLGERIERKQNATT